MNTKNFFAGILAAILAAFSSFAGAAYQFSEYGFSRNPARLNNSLRVEMTGRSALRSYRFVKDVGGVNFDNLIELSDDSVDIDYVKSAEDGQRVRIKVNEWSATLPLYDWELKPIVEYADSKYTAVVSIFGEGPDSKNFYYIDYHPAFEDTHIGVRLLQADILLMDPIVFSEAPAENGKKIYKPGEAHEQPRDLRTAGALIINSIMKSEPYQSWVLTDMDPQENIRLENGIIQIDVTTYYHVWKPINPEQREQLINSYDRLVNVARARLNEREVSSDVHALNDVKRLDSILEGIYKEMTSLRAQIENFEPEIVDVEGITSKLRDSEELLHEIAPFVYDAVHKTARYAALFRGVKKDHPEEWKSFRQTVVESIDLAPVETPNQFKR